MSGYFVNGLRSLRAALPVCVAFAIVCTNIADAHVSISANDSKDTSENIAAEKPNIVIIYTDDLGFGDISFNGAKGVETPNIDRLARNGLNFTDSHCSAATCTPSRVALLTGTYAFRTNARILPGNAAMTIRPGTSTIASLLKSTGYKTGVVGKWHLGLGDGESPIDWNQQIKPGPAEIGFDYSFLIPATGDRVPCVYTENGKVVGLDGNDPIAVDYQKRIDDRLSGREQRDQLKMNWSVGHNQTVINGIGRIGWMTGGKRAIWVDEDMADVISSKAVDFIDRNKDQPFFLYFATHDIHVPRVPNPRFVGKSTMGPRGDAIVQVDYCVQQVVKALESHKLLDNTLIIFTSDNGPVLDDGYQDQANEKLGDHQPGGPYRAGKYSLFEGGTRVPFIVHWPARIEQPGTSDALFGQVDLAASLAKLAGADIPDGQCRDSRDQLDTLLGEDKTGRPHLIHEAGRLALRMGKWKYIPGKKTQDLLGPWKQAEFEPGFALFDLHNDPGEKNNVATDHPEIVQRMQEKLAYIRNNNDAE